MSRHGLALFCIALAGCAGVQPPAPPSAGAGALCHDEGLGRFVGQPASAESGAALLNTSGARSLRWGGPGVAMTMDFRADRLTVRYDEKMLILSARCG